LALQKLIKPILKIEIIVDDGVTKLRELFETIEADTPQGGISIRNLF
jgi:hypothetical protein